MAATTVRPCRRPKVWFGQVCVEAGTRLAMDAVCVVPGCSWRYVNVVKSDVEEQAARHRAAHRNAVPSTAVVRDAEWDAHCSPCGGHRRTFSTRRAAEEWLAEHLIEEHGVVTCE